MLGLGDFPRIPVPLPDQHICNVRTSNSYMGKKVKEGYLRKEGSLFRTIKIRWFVLHSTGLFYYENDRCKAFIKKISLREAQIGIVDDHRFPHHFSVIKDQKTLHLWAESAGEKEVWVRNLMRVIAHLLSNSPV